MLIGEFEKFFNEPSMDWKESEKNYEELLQCDKRAKKLQTLIGRFITHPFADGHAHYMIIRENKKTVRIRVIRSIGDGWVFPAWGWETSIPKSYAEEEIRRREAITKLFSKKG